MASPQKRRPPARRPVEPEGEPVFSGRLMIAAAMLVPMAFAPTCSLVKTPGGNPGLPAGVAQGQTISLAVSIVTADYTALGCASDQVYAGSHCQFKDVTNLHPATANEPLEDGKATVLQPYRTWPDNQLVFLSGLWSEPNVALRLHREPAAGVPVAKLARFVARCDVAIVGCMGADPAECQKPEANRAKTSRLRWQATGNFGEEAAAWVGKVQSCRLEGAE